MILSSTPPKEPPRMHVTKAANKLDAAQLTSSSTKADNRNKTDDNDMTTMGTITKRKSTANPNTILLTTQLSADKATMTKKKHLQFHSPLIKGPMKMMTESTTTKIQNQQQQQQQEQFPQSLFANVISDNATKANGRMMTKTTTKYTQTIQSSILQETYQHHNHHYYAHHHHHIQRDKHYARVSKAMSLKVTAERATGSTVARSRLDRGCTSLMYACQHGDISEVIEQLRNKVDNCRVEFLLKQNKSNSIEWNGFL